MKCLAAWRLLGPSWPCVCRAVAYESKYDPGQIVAHCLELDLIGMGTTAEEAVEELREMIDGQVWYCREFGTEIGFEAEAEILALWPEEQR